MALPDTLITRRQLAELYGVTVEAIGAWERRGKGPPKVTDLKRGDLSPALYRCGEARDWLGEMVAAQNAAAAAFDAPSPAEPPKPVVNDRAARNAKALDRVRQLEKQLIEDERVEPAQKMNSGWRAFGEADELL